MNNIQLELDLKEALNCVEDHDEALELIKHIDVTVIGDTGFSVKHLKWLFESLTNDISKEQLIKFLETGDEAAIKDW